MEACYNKLFVLLTLMSNFTNIAFVYMMKQNLHEFNPLKMFSMHLHIFLKLDKLLLKYYV